MLCLLDLLGGNITPMAWLGAAHNVGHGSPGSLPSWSLLGAVVYPVEI